MEDLTGDAPGLRRVLRAAARYSEALLALDEAERRLSDSEVAAGREEET